jgi:hypothetical protein
MVSQERSLLRQLATDHLLHYLQWVLAVVPVLLHQAMAYLVGLPAPCRVLFHHTPPALSLVLRVRMLVMAGRQLSKLLIKRLCESNNWHYSKPPSYVKCSVVWRKSMIKVVEVLCSTHFAPWTISCRYQSTRILPVLRAENSVTTCSNIR